MTVILSLIVLSYSGRYEEALYSTRVVSEDILGERSVICDDILWLMNILQHFAVVYSNLSLELENLVCQSSIVASLPLLSQNTPTPGRPRIIISKDQLSGLIGMGFSYSRIAKMFGISVRTLYRRRTEFGMQIGRNYCDISDNDLDAVVLSLVQVRYLPSQFCKKR